MLDLELLRSFVSVVDAGGFTRAADVPVKPGAYVMIWGRHCFFGYTVSPNGEIWWFANPPSRSEIPRDELRRLTTDRLREDLAGLLAADRTPGAAIVRATSEDFGLSNQYDLPTVPTWHNGSMVVIGDAAHAVSPSSGQGASLAAEDAVVLATCLRDVPGIPAALDEYAQAIKQYAPDRAASGVDWQTSGWTAGKLFEKAAAAGLQCNGSSIGG